MTHFNNSNLPISFLNFINESKHTIFVLIDEKLNILDYNKCFSKLLGLKKEKLSTLDKYLNLHNKQEITLEKLLTNSSKFNLYTKKELALSFRCSKCELAKYENSYLIIGEVEFNYDINVIEKMSKITSELAASTMELHKKNSQIDTAMKKIEKQHNTIVSQSRFVAINELTVMLAHQWRQPLSIINMYNNLLKIELMDLDTQTNDLNKYIEESEKIIFQLSETIDLFTKSFEDDDIEQTSINTILKNIIKLSKPNFKSGKVTLVKELNSKDLINIQPSTFTQISTILLQNSFDAFHKNQIKNRTLNIKSYDENQYVVIEYSDNAGGIDEKIISKVFDPYFSTKNEKNNTGLGLYTAYILTTDILKGFIQIQNQSNGILVQIKLPK